jgi:hypothetical protein
MVFCRPGAVPSHVRPPSTLATTAAWSWLPAAGAPYTGMSSCPLTSSTIFALVAGCGSVLERTTAGAENAASSASR